MKFRKFVDGWRSDAGIFFFDASKPVQEKVKVSFTARNKKK